MRNAYLEMLPHYETHEGPHDFVRTIGPPHYIIAWDEYVIVVTARARIVSYRGFKRKVGVAILLLFASLPDCTQNQTAVSDTVNVLSDF
jgi:hypothetical protein